MLEAVARLVSGLNNKPGQDEYTTVTAKGRCLTALR
jgi:hypothetical protein